MECKDIYSAQSLVSIAISCGFRESGITSVSKRVIVAIRCSIRLEVPLGDTHKLMVSPEYVKYLVEISNEKMEANRRRTGHFHTALLSNGFQEPKTNVESGDTVDSECVEAKKSESCLDSSSNYPQEDVILKMDEEYDSNCGSAEVPVISSLSTIQMVIVGQPIERIYLWGHSACVFNTATHKKVLIFGGFGGMGSHARRNDYFLLDPLCGKLEEVDTQGRPSPRLGHTSSLVGDLMYVIGGRADPLNILNDVWVLNTKMRQWKLLECTGTEFPPRHRHAAAIVGPKVYVFGGIHDDLICSTLHVLDTQNLEWNEICIRGEWPCPRHSHSMVAYGSKLFIFGGYDGEKALGDLYSFNVQTCLWKKENMAGRTPYARFSHSMFVYKHFIGIIGGCPVRQHYQELSILDLQSCSWKHVMLNSVGKDLFVRSTATVIADDLVMIGGGASCYAFGTKFGEPMKMNLLPLISLTDGSITAKVGENKVNYQHGAAIETKNGLIASPRNKIDGLSDGASNLKLENEGLGIKCAHKEDASHFVLQLEKKYAKFGKDLLKKFGWLDLERKVYSQENGRHVYFPVTGKFCDVYQNKQHRGHDAVIELSDLNLLEQVNGRGILSKDISSSSALSLLMACGATKLADEFIKVRKTPNSPLKLMSDAVTSLINNRGLAAHLLEQLPTRWERLGDIVVLPATSFKDPVWDSIARDLWPTIAESLGTRRLARQGRVANNGTRDSTLEILVGDNGWVGHRENGILYSFDATKCMFSWGNLSEKLRMARLDCADEVIVDLFAGIGYFVLPFLVRANAKMVYACEWNPHAVEALQHNLHANFVADRCVVLEGDNRVTAPKGVADRVCLGLLPTSEGSWVTAVRALRSKGGILHVHGNVKDSEEVLWSEHVAKSINEIATSEGYNWKVSVEHVERVKWYAPHIRHIVADVKCEQI